MEELEIWKDVVGYEGKYIVSNMGRLRIVFSFHKDKIGKFNKLLLTNKGYLRVHLTKDGRSIKHAVHRLVLTAFKGPSDLQIDHINGNTQDNRLENLEYVTGSENSFRKFERRGSTSRHRGVYYHQKSGIWSIELRVCQGGYRDEEKARVAYQELLTRLFR